MLMMKKKVEVGGFVVGVGEKKWWPEIGGLSPESWWPEEPVEVVEVKEMLEVRVLVLGEEKKEKDEVKMNKERRRKSIYRFWIL